MPGGGRVLPLLELLALLAPVPPVASALRVSAFVPSHPSSKKPSTGRPPSGCRRLAGWPSLGAPPIWPCKQREQKEREEKLRAALDQWNKSSKPGSLLRAAEEQPPKNGEGLGRLEGAQPFLFGHLVASSVGLVREMERPVDNQVVLRMGALDGQGFGVPESVFFDEGRFVMFYRSQVISSDNESGTPALGWAESQDGITWYNKQRLNVSGINWSLESCVLLDEYEKDPQFKWKMTANCRHPPDTICFFSSPDGVHWQPHGASLSISGKHADTLPCLYHDGPGKDYQLIRRFEPPNPARQGRGIRGSEVLSGPLDDVIRSIDTPVAWNVTALNSFILDRETGGAEMFRRQLYSLSRTPLSRAGYLGVAQVYEFVDRTHVKAFWEKGRSAAAALGLGEEFDSVHLYLMPSRDGIHFDPAWIYAGVRLLPEDARHGGHFFNQAGQVLTRDGYHWFYYDRTPQRHWGRFLDKGGAEIALARFREGRVVRIRPASQQPGTLVTHGFTFDPTQRLTLDLLSPSSESEVVAALLPAWGKRKDWLQALDRKAAVEAAPIRGANGSAQVRWLGDTAKIQGQQVHLRLVLRGAWLFGFTLGD